jgi:hypothetical protein
VCLRREVLGQIGVHQDQARGPPVQEAEEKMYSSRARNRARENIDASPAIPIGG